MAKYLLLDANIVIEAYEKGFWTHLIQICPISLPSIVIEEADRYFRRENGGIPKELQVKDLAENGEIESVEANLNDIVELTKILNDSVLKGLDPGEEEALAIIYKGELKDYIFCTGDGLAIKALALLGKSDKGISFEIALKELGMIKQLNF